MSKNPYYKYIIPHDIEKQPILDKTNQTNTNKHKIKGFITPNDIDQTFVSREQNSVSDDVVDELISNKTKLKWLFFATLFLFFSGIFIGFVPIKTVILRSMIYPELQIDLSMVISMTLMSLITFPVGLFLDKYGSKKTAIFGAILQTSGHLLVAFCFFFDLPISIFIIALALDSLANPFVFTSIIQFTRLFKSYENFLMGYFTGIWDLSALLGFLVLLLDQNNVPISVIFFGSGFIYLIFLFLVFIIFPKYELPKNSDNQNTNNNLNQLEDNVAQVDYHTINNNINTYTQTNNISTLLMAIFAASANILCMNFYMINFHNVLMIWNQTQSTDFVVHLFSITFPCIGFIAAIATGSFIDKYGLKPSIFLMALFQTIFISMSIISIYEFHGFAFFPYIFYRMMFYTFLNVCVIKINPNKIGLNLGLVYGISSIVNLSNYGFSYLATVTNDYFWIHFGLCLFALISTFFWSAFLPIA